MKTKKLENLFKLITFLHSNIDKFNSYQNILNELETLSNKRDNLNPERNYKEKLNFDLIQKEIKEKFDIINENIVKVILLKTEQLGICDINNLVSIFNNNINEINNIKSNFTEKDIEEIKSHQLKYVNFRTKTNSNYFALFLYFKYLDDLLKRLFEYFVEENKKDFEAFELKTVKVKSISDAATQFQKDNNLASFFIEKEVKNDNLPHEPVKQTETKTEKLKAELGKYGFFDLPKVRQLSEPNKQRLVEMISTNGLPYSIAMLEFLGFLNHILNEHFKTKYKLNKEVAKWFNSDKEGRAVKGNISTLSEYTNEDKGKYTAHTHKETVNIDYQKLK